MNVAYRGVRFTSLNPGREKVALESVVRSLWVAHLGQTDGILASQVDPGTISILLLFVNPDKGKLAAFMDALIASGGQEISVDQFHQIQLLGAYQENTM